MPDRRTGQQLVHAITRDGICERLTPPALDNLLKKGAIMMFRRLNGWVGVGIDPIRVKDRREASRSFNGPEKRPPF